MALKEVTRGELQAVIARLKAALYNHRQWYGALIRTLVRKLPGNTHDRYSKAHTDSRFGRQ